MSYPKRNGKVAWAATADEKVEMREELKIRRAIDPAERVYYPTPPAAQASVFGAVYYELRKLLQDHPAFVAFGIVGGLISIFY